MGQRKQNTTTTTQNPPYGHEEVTYHVSINLDRSSLNAIVESVDIAVRLLHLSGCGGNACMCGLMRSCWDMIINSFYGFGVCSEIVCHWVVLHAWFMDLYKKI